VKGAAVIPMEPETGKFPLAEQEKYLYQVKWDGIRLLAARCSAGGIILQGRRLKEKTRLYPELVEALQEVVHSEDWLLDGELIVLKNNRPSFYHIMQREKNSALRLTRQVLAEYPVHYMVFDLLRFGGKDLTAQPLYERLRLLSDIIKRRELVVPVDSFDDGELLLQVTQQQGLEGIVAKRKESPYVFGPRKSPYWKKIKHWRLRPLLVGGILLREALLSSLLVGAYDEEGCLRYLGRVGSGLTRQEHIFLKKALPELQRRSSPFAEAVCFPKGLQVAWLEPVLAVRVRFQEWTESAKLRAPSFQGFIRGCAPAAITLGQL
jgi:bifunctional non-homologous end joining protein LigD